MSHEIERQIAQELQDDQIDRIALARWKTVPQLDAQLVHESECIGDTTGTELSTSEFQSRYWPGPATEAGRLAIQEARDKITQVRKELGERPKLRNKPTVHAEQRAPMPPYKLK